MQLARAILFVKNLPRMTASYRDRLDIADRDDGVDPEGNVFQLVARRPHPAGAAGAYT
jgi:hypothetical protein